MIILLTNISSSPVHVENTKQQITSNDVDPVTSRDDSAIDPVKRDEPYRGADHATLSGAAY
jgi:hypothetical protein